MKNYILLVAFGFLLLGNTNAQSQKSMATFSQQQQYFNPSLTGFEGSMLKTLYRNQWTGFEDAPKTILASAELNLKELSRQHKGYQLGNQKYTNYLESISSKNAIGITVLHEQFGPSKETELFMSYGAGVRLSENLSLRWGTALTYSNHRLDGNSLSVDQENDPRFINVFGHNNRISKFDLNLGIALSSGKFYAGYAVQGVTEGKLIMSGDDYLNQLYSRRHIGQAGFRTSLSDQIGITANSIFMYDGNQPSTLEMQLKGVYQNFFWVGGGYRVDKAYSVVAGLRLSQLGIHYAYESPIQDARYINISTNEISLTYQLKNIAKDKAAGRVLVW